MDFIEKVKQFRYDNGIGQGDFARRLGIPASTLSNWENGTRGVPDARQKLIQDFMDNYTNPAQKIAPKGSNQVTPSKNGSTVTSDIEASATRLGMAVVAVRRAEIEVAKLKPQYDAYLKAEADLEAAKADLQQMEETLLKKVG